MSAVVALWAEGGSPEGGSPEGNHSLVGQEGDLHSLVGQEDQKELHSLAVYMHAWVTMACMHTIVKNIVSHNE